MTNMTDKDELAFFVLDFSAGGGQLMSCRDHLRVAQLLLNRGLWRGADGAPVRLLAEAEGGGTGRGLRGTWGEGRGVKPVVAPRTAAGGAEAMATSCVRCVR